MFSFNDIHVLKAIFFSLLLLTNGFQILVKLTPTRNIINTLDHHRDDIKHKFLY